MLLLAQIALAIWAVSLGATVPYILVPFLLTVAGALVYPNLVWDVMLLVYLIVLITIVKEERR